MRMIYYDASVLTYEQCRT